MNVIREFIKVKNYKIELDLPKDFDYEEVEVIVLPKEQDKFWVDDEIANIGKIGFVSSSFEDDEEDYTKW